MVLRIFDRVKQVTSSTGTGNITLGGTPNGFQSFSDVFTSGDTTYICIENGSNWEVSRATYGVAGSGTLSRDTILDSSTGAAINLSGRSTVFCTVPAAKYAYLDPSGEINLSLGGLSDATITSPATGNILSYNGSQWVNSVPDPGYSDEQAQDAIGGILGSGTDIVLSYNDSTPAITGALTNTTVTPGSYTLSSITVDQKGRVTAASSGSVDLSSYVPYSGANSGVNLGTYALTCGAITASGVVTLADGSNASPSLVWGNGFGAYRSSFGTAYKGGIELFHNGSRSAYLAWDGFSVRSDAAIGFSSTTTTQQGGGGDAYFVRNFASSIGVKGAAGIDGALTCGAITASSFLSLQNSTTPMEFNLHNTYTSATSREYLKMLAVTGGAYQIGSAIGSAGGTNRAISFGHWNAAGTFSGTATITTGGRFSDNGGTPDDTSAIFGAGTSVFLSSGSKDRQTVFGGAAQSLGPWSVVVGGQAITELGGVAIGASAYATNQSVAIGLGAGANGTSGGVPSSYGVNGYIILRANSGSAAPTAQYQFIVSDVRDGYFGNGITNASPQGFKLNATGGSGTNIAGASFTLAGGMGTGTGAGGSLIFQTAPAGSSGTSLNSLVTRLTIDSTGTSTFSGLVSVSYSNSGTTLGGSSGIPSQGLALVNTNGGTSGNPFGILFGGTAGYHHSAIFGVQTFDVSIQSFAKFTQTTG